MRLSVTGLIAILLFMWMPQAYAQQQAPTSRQMMHCSVQSENTTRYPHSGKTAALGYGTLFGIVLGIATSGASTFFYVLAASVGIGASVDHVDYKGKREENYSHCVSHSSTAVEASSPTDQSEVKASGDS